MKKLMIVLTVVISIVGFAFAQQVSIDETNAEIASIEFASHCYTMKAGLMYTCNDIALATMKESVTLSNGGIITTKGEVIARNGKTQLLFNGQCVDMAGNISDYAKHDGK